MKHRENKHKNHQFVIKSNGKHREIRCATCNKEIEIPRNKRK